MNGEKFHLNFLKEWILLYHFITLQVLINTFMKGSCQTLMYQGPSLEGTEPPDES